VLVDKGDKLQGAPEAPQAAQEAHQGAQEAHQGAQEAHQGAPGAQPGAQQEALALQVAVAMAEEECHLSLL
jgi:hypothetical protein